MGARVLGGIIATGETSHVRCLQRVADAIAAGHDRLAEIAQDAQRVQALQFTAEPGRNR